MFAWTKHWDFDITEEMDNVVSNTFHYCRLSNFLKYGSIATYKKYDIKEQLNKFIAKHVAQILGQNFRYRLYH